jgi:CheY-like chemotaxis protein
MNTYKVLIAEDNQFIGSLIAKILSELNIENTIVQSGDDALVAYNNDYYDMVLLDIIMPGLTGLEVSKEIRKTNSHIPIVALTSLPFEQIEDELSKCGINHYISKPPKATELQDLLKAYFRSAA